MWGDISKVADERKLTPTEIIRKAVRHFLISIRNREE
jgi:hypothetical protein